jgi:hypothetical protein
MVELSTLELQLVEMATLEFTLTCTVIACSPAAFTDPKLRKITKLNKPRK